MLKIALTWSWSIPLCWHLTNTNNGRHILQAWLDKDYRSARYDYIILKSRSFKVEPVNKLEKPGTEQAKIHKHNSKQETDDTSGIRSSGEMFEY